MEKYRNLSGDSGVVAFENGVDYINIQFVSGDVYTYSYKKAGRTHVEQMKILASKGKGLSTYINKYVRNLYD
jgi:hypothetical protein